MLRLWHVGLAGCSLGGPHFSTIAAAREPADARYAGRSGFSGLREADPGGAHLDCELLSGLTGRAMCVSARKKLRLPFRWVMGEGSGAGWAAHVVRRRRDPVRKSSANARVLGGVFLPSERGEKTGSVSALPAGMACQCGSIAFVWAMQCGLCDKRWGVGDVGMRRFAARFGRDKANLRFTMGAKKLVLLGPRNVLPAVKLDRRRGVVADVFLLLR